jgi:hypothetical protein
MPPNEFTWITQTQQEATMQQRGSRIFDNARKQNHSQFDTIARVRRIGEYSGYLWSVRLMLMKFQKARAC